MIQVIDFLLGLEKEDLGLWDSQALDKTSKTWISAERPNLTLSFKFCGGVRISFVMGERLLTNNAGYHTGGVCKASGKSLRQNKVKASMCKQLLSLSLKDNV